MSIFQNALGIILGLQGVDVTIKDLSDGTVYPVRAAISNYFRSSLVEEEITGRGRQYVISSKDLAFLPRRGDQFRLSSTEFYQISDVQEMVAFNSVIGYRLVLK